MASGWVRPDDVINATSQWTGISRARLLEPFGTRRECAARSVAYAVMRELLGMSYPEIGSYLNREHQTVMTCLRRYEPEPEDVNGVAQLAQQIRDER